MKTKCFVVAFYDEETNEDVRYIYESSSNPLNNNPLEEVQDWMYTFLDKSYCYIQEANEYEIRTLELINP